MYNHSDFGLWGEAQAQKYLKKKGLKIVAANFETKLGEIDIICVQTKKSAKLQAKKLLRQIEQAHGIDKFDLHKKLTQKHFECAEDVLVFVEVKSRSGESAGVVLPSEAVDDRKQNKYEKLAKQFVLTYKQFDDKPWRFDIVEVVKTGKNLNINHIECAF